MRGILALCLALSAAPVAAWEVCDELWFTRNLVYDRGGFCFSTPLAQSVFSSAGCIPGDPVLTRSAEEQVIAVQGAEAELGCEVDTKRDWLGVPWVAQRMALEDIPIPSIYESGCFGWRGAPIILRSARRVDAPETGRIETGDDIHFTFEGVDEWSFVVSTRGDGQMGWFREDVWGPKSCVSVAG